METERLITVERRLKLTPRTCVVCAREFPSRGRQRFCSKPCQRKWDYRQHAEVRRANRREYYRRQKDESAPSRSAVTSEQP